MDFDKLLNHDAEEWRAIQERVFGTVSWVCSTFRDSLTGSDIFLIAEETYILAMQKIASIEPLKFWAWISGTAYKKALTLTRSKSGPRSIAGKSESLDERVEKAGEAGELAGGRNPVIEIQAQERLTLFHELFSLLATEDREIIFDCWVEGLTGREMAEKHGWGEKGDKSATRRCQQAWNRMCKVFASEPRAAKLISELKLNPDR